MPTLEKMARDYMLIYARKVEGERLFEPRLYDISNGNGHDIQCMLCDFTVFGFEKS